LPQLQVHVLVVDDYEPWIHFVRSKIKCHKGLMIVGEVYNGMEAVEQAKTLQPDLVLLDIGLPGLNGIEAARAIRSIVPRSKILFLSENRDPEIIDEALATGSHGYVLKSQAESDLLPALKIVLSGSIFVSQRAPDTD
jgi:two-component system, NarL family, nitrate/nitrite response regulator NarL